MAGTPAHVSFTTTKKRVNSTAEVVMGEPLNCFLKDLVSIITPTLYIHLEHNSPSYVEVFKYNYMYIEEFSRYYFITDIISESSKLVLISGQIDVLGTYREEILNTKAFIQYSAVLSNPLLHDTRIHVERKGHMQVSDVLAFDFVNTGGCYIVTFGSEGGVSQSAVMTELDMRNLGAKLWGTSAVEKLKDNLLNPISLISSCVWIPITPDKVRSGTTFDFKVADETIMSGLSKAKEVVEGNITYNFAHLMPWEAYNRQTGEYSYGTYLNIEPYTQVKILLPGVGVVQLPLDQIMGTAHEPDYNIEIMYNFSPITGEIQYELRKLSGFAGSSFYKMPLLLVHGSLGTSISISSSATNVAGALSSGINTVVSTGVSAVGAALTGSPYMALAGARQMITGTADTVLQANTTQNSLSGYMGGFESAYFNQWIVFILEWYNPSDTAQNYDETIGLPYFKASLIKDHIGGVIKCTGAWVEAEGATQTEQQMIAQYVNSSANFIYGGLIVE